MASITEDGNNRNEVKCKNNRSIDQDKHNCIDIFANYTQTSIQTKLSSSSIDIVVTKNLNSA